MFVNQSVDSYDRKSENYIVAYLDLLGVTKRIKAKEQQELGLNKLHNLYTYSLDLTKDIQIKENKDIQFKIFSDNIIIAKKLSLEKAQRIKDIRSLLMCAGRFQELAASGSVGWMLRGGITIGELFLDDIMVWGEALLKEYYLEDQVANYPRVIIDNNVITEIAGCNLDDYFRSDFDELHFLNYLCNCSYCGQPLVDGFEIMKTELGSNIDEKTKQKYSWHMNYINAELDRKNEKEDKKYRLKM